MDQRKKILQRVRDDADTLKKLISSQSSNVPIDTYVDPIGIQAISDSLGLDPDQWDAEDLEKVLIIRDGIYDIRNNLRDMGDDSEHSVDQILSAVDRLYADLERAMIEFGTDNVNTARRNLDLLQNSQKLVTSQFRPATEVILQQAREVLSQTHITNRSIEINLVKIDNVNLEMFKSAKLQIQRFSASVVAINFSLEQKVIFQGIFKFLNDNADKIIEDLKKFANNIKSTYGSVKDMVSDISKLADMGSKFTKQVASFVEKLFHTPDNDVEKSISFRTRSNLSGSSILCGLSIQTNTAITGGRRGLYLLLDKQTGKKIDQKYLKQSDILSMCYLDNNEIAFGTDEGLRVAKAIGKDTLVKHANYNEKVVSVVKTGWGGYGSAIVTASADGFIRRWTHNLQRYHSEVHKREIVVKVGRNATKILNYGTNIIVASGTNLYIFDEFFDDVKKLSAPFIVDDICLFNINTIIACGEGNIAYINTETGSYTRIISASSSMNYTCITKISEDMFLAGTDDGSIVAMEHVSGVEIGSTNIGMHIRGMINTKNSLLVFGGQRNSTTGKCLYMIDWSQSFESASKNIS